MKKNLTRFLLLFFFTSFSCLGFANVDINDLSTSATQVCSGVDQITITVTVDYTSTTTEWLDCVTINLPAGFTFVVGSEDAATDAASYVSDTGSSVTFGDPIFCPGGGSDFGPFGGSPDIFTFDVATPAGHCADPDAPLGFDYTIDTSGDGFGTGGNPSQESAVGSVMAPPPSNGICGQTIEFCYGNNATNVIVGSICPSNPADLIETTAVSGAINPAFDILNVWTGPFDFTNNTFTPQTMIAGAVNPTPGTVFATTTAGDCIIFEIGFSTGVVSCQDGFQPPFVFDSECINPCINPDVKDFPPIPGKDCVYLLKLDDSASDGWDGASIDVSIGEAWPATNYKVTPQDGSCALIPIYVNDGETIDLSYWNGANETEHSITLLDALGEVAVDQNGDLVQYSGNIPANTQIRIKADCPLVPCIGMDEDFTVRITMGGFPEEQSWEIYEGPSSTTAQGSQVIGVNATAYTGLAPGFQLDYDISLDKCQIYTFVGFDGFNDSWNGGTWELISANLNYGTEITNPLDSHYGESLVVGPIAPANDETRTEFTIPCENTCERFDVVNASAATCVTSNPIDLPVTAPIICYPYCQHAEGCDIEVQHIVLAAGLNGSANPGLVYSEGFFVLSGTPFNYNGQTSNVFDGEATGFGLPQGVLPVGCHKYVTKYTYCDGVMVKCTADLNIVTQTNPTLTCNDNIIISLGAPELLDDDNLSGDSYIDDLGECVVRVTPDMVLEMPASVCAGVFEEYEVTILDESGEPLVVTGANGLPLDQFGLEIPTQVVDREPAHDLIGPAQEWQTLTYVIEHKFSGNKCWGTLSIEDKLDPIIICNDYDLNCTHPNALDEFYTHTDVFTAGSEIPANIAGGNAGLPSNTFIPVNLPCAPLGEVIQNVQVNLNLTHNDVTDLSVELHLPQALIDAGIASPINLDTNGDVGPSNVYTPNPVNDAPGLLSLIGAACSLTESTNPEEFVTENSGNQVPANAGGTWYIQIIDNNATFPTPPFGGGQVTAASITLTCGFPFPYFAADCTLEGVELINEMVAETFCDQSDWNGAQIMRTWQATDKGGRTSTCVQTIGLKAPMMDQIVAPGDIAIPCEGQTPDQITPDISGVPTFGCFDLTDSLHDLCDISYTYEDQVLYTCGDGFKIIRTWTILNWCSTTTKYYEQIIKVEDTEGPTIAQEDATVGTDPYDCEANISLDDLGITDNCSGVQSVTATYTSGGGAYVGSGQLVIVDLLNDIIEDVPMGMTQVLIKAKDACLNETEKLITITVVDDTPPIPVCDDQLHVSLGSDGTARLNAEDVDEGSYDNCSPVTLEVRRTDGCLGASPWGPYVPFECCDVDENITVELRVTDAAGNSNVCWKTALVEDALPPVITCPGDKTLNCNDPAVHDPFGTAAAIDNCNVTMTETDSGELDQCKSGTLTRTWTATDGSSKSADASCSQEIEVVHVSDFVVQFPADITLTNCAEQDAGEPTFSDDDCELLAVSADTLVLDIVDDACYKLEITWTVINWCVYDQGNDDNTDLGFPQPLPRTYQDDGDGYFQYTQIVKVLDAVAPEIVCPGDQTFCDLTEECEGQADLILEASDACSPTSALEYIYKIDEFNDGSIDIIDNGNDASGIYPYGTHLIKWIVEDGCGNTSTCEYLFTVEDCKNPTPVCLNGISLPGMNSDGCVEVWANDLLEYGFDNCSSDDYIYNSAKIRREGDTAAPQTAITLCCEDLGTVIVEVWVEDEAGNADYCTTYIIVQDPNGICGSTGGEDDSRMIAGTIETEDAEMVEDVMVDIDGSNGMSNALPTGINGNYTFPNLNQNINYTVTPTKDLDPTNGVSTYDLVLMSQHILGVNALTSPYALIAADVNSDGVITTFDVVQNRQLILFVISDFPSNTSWRFVDKSYVFPVSTNPWYEVFPEAIDVNNLTQDEMLVDFIAVKVGDVDGNATPNTLVGAEERNMTGTLVMSVEDAELKAGNTTSIEFRASDFDGINGFQYTMNFDAAAMNFAGVEAGALAVSEANFGFAMLNEGVITTSWNTSEATNVANDEVLFTLNFNITSNVVLSDAVSVNSKYTSAEAYAGNDLMDVAIAFNTESGSVVSGGAFELYQNTPNPFNGETVIGFNVPTTTTATLKVYDVSGKVLKVIEGEYARGYNTISLNSNELNASGIIYYQLDTPANSATMKMIIIE